MSSTPRFFTALFCLTLAAPALFAQSYKTAIGVRVDNGLNISAQQHIVDHWTVEGILHTPFRTDDLGLTVLAERHQKILFRGINLYWGAGGHYYWTNGTINREDEREVNNNVYGLSLIGGAEISLGRINISADWKPELHLSGDLARPFDWNGAAISVRYILAKRERPSFRDWKIFGKDNSRKKGKRR